MTPGRADRAVPSAVEGVGPVQRMMRATYIRSASCVPDALVLSVLANALVIGSAAGGTPFRFYVELDSSCVTGEGIGNAEHVVSLGLRTAACAVASASLPSGTARGRLI